MCLSTFPLSIFMLYYGGDLLYVRIGGYVVDYRRCRDTFPIGFFIVSPMTPLLTARPITRSIHSQSNFPDNIIFYFFFLSCHGPYTFTYICFPSRSQYSIMVLVYVAVFFSYNCVQCTSVFLK